jgi:nitroimidazol reductase NimA-like FMN-containing flavoprotein (pyridoxamine 5'-phosphate oxidase superfamily)
MLVHELTPHECAEILERTTLGRLACARDGQPYVVPIHFSFDIERSCVYCFSMIGQKVNWMRDNPRVCLEVEDVASKDHWQTVLVFGRYEEIQDSPEEAEARQRAQLRFAQRPEWWLPAAAKVGSRERHAIVVYRIQIDRVTGRRASRGIGDGPNGL